MKTSLWLNVDHLTEKMINIGSFVYAFNNPIKDAPSKVTNVKNVLQGKKWVDYQDVYSCGKAARQQNNQIKNSSPAYDGDQIYMVIDKKRQDIQDNFR